MSMEGLKLKDISVGYGNRRVLSDVSAALPTGEVMVLLGANGVGKTTLLKTIAGLLPPLSGELYLNDIPLLSMEAADKAKKIALMLTEIFRSEAVSCRELVSLGRYPYTGRFGILSGEDKAIVEEAMEQCAVSDLAERDVRSLSDGQRQRVLLARAIAQQPQLMLLDEPAAHLDLRYQLDFLTLLRRLCEERGCMALLSMHETGPAIAAADRLLCLKDGAVFSSGTPQEALPKDKLKELYDVDPAVYRRQGQERIAEYAESLGADATKAYVYVTTQNIPRGLPKRSVGCPSFAAFPPSSEARLCMAEMRNCQNPRGSEQLHVYKDGKKLRKGYTTGSCAAAAAKCAARSLLRDEPAQDKVYIRTPSGVGLTLPVLSAEAAPGHVKCGVKKDAGDDPDVTDGMIIYADVSLADDGIKIDGGEGIGRVTRPGLDRPVGDAAINSVPRAMIEAALYEEAEAAAYTGGFCVLISAPGGEEIAKKTFNPQLGIEGGISILGTGGIVEPMSEQALIDTIRADISMRAAEGKKHILLAPGNYGEEFIRERMGLSLTDCVKCSNYIGEALDMAAEFGMEAVLLVGHIGKLVKLGSGILNTHSRIADGRMETLASCLLRAGGGAEQARELLSCNTTEEAVEKLRGFAMLEPCMDELCKAVDETLSRRAAGRFRAGAVIFSKQSGLCVCTPQAEEEFNDGTFCRGRLGSA